MSRRAASFTQADVARAMRAAEQVGAHWQVEIVGGAMRLFRGETAIPVSAKVALPPEVPDPAEQKWKL